LKRAFAVAATFLILAACSKDGAEVAQPQRTAIEFRYVGPAKVSVRSQPSSSAPEIAAFERGESVSILAKSGSWAEVRVADGSGWIPVGDLVTTVQQEKIEADNTTPHFITPPPAVTDLGVHGEIVLEANVNSDGDVTSVRVIRNSTGSPGLAFKNSEALKRAKFTPVVRGGRHESFIYEHRVSY
jgi:TonB family protein